MSELMILSGQLISPAEPRRPQAEVELRQESDAERRAKEGLAYAASLPSAQCRAIHIELASRYAQMAAALRQAERQFS